MPRIPFCGYIFFSEQMYNLTKCVLLNISSTSCRVSNEVSVHGGNSFCVKLALSYNEVTASLGADILVSRASGDQSRTRKTNSTDSLYVSYIVCTV